MKLTLLFAAILFILPALAQNCSNDLLLQTSGTLKADAAAGGRELKATDLTKQKNVLASIVNMIKSKYTPMGVQAIYHENYGSGSPNRPANDYSYSIIPLNYYCEGSAVKTAHETSSYFSINANSMEAEIYDTAQGDRLLLEGFNVLNSIPVYKNDCWYFGEMDAGLGFGMTGKSSSWLITYDHKLPFAYVTKSEFLKKRNQALFEQMQMSATDAKDVLERIEIEKKYKETELKNDPEKLKKYMKMDYLQTKERYEKLLADNEKKYKPAFDKIDLQLKMPAGELNQQAIVKMDPNDPLSYLFTDSHDPSGKILIKPNPDYFNKKLPKSSPQFIWVYVRGNHKEPIATKFMTDIMKAVDFTTLKNMLGK
jgi:hypothetical protein